MLPGGARVMDEIGYDATVSRAQLAVFIRDELAAPVAFVEWFREDEVLSGAVLEEVGGRLEATKISAGSEIKTIARLGGSGDPVCAPIAPEDRATLATLVPAALSAAAIDEIRAELAGAAWAQHYSSYNKAQSWTAFALRGFAEADPFDIIKPAEMSKAWKAEHPERLEARCSWTTAAAAFPHTLALIAQLNTSTLGSVDFERVRFMRLAPGGGELARHADITDRAAGTRAGAVMRLHIPIETTPLCAFTAWSADGRRLDVRMTVGALCYLDQRKPHRVINRHPTEARTHLVLDAYANDRLRALLARAAG